MMHLLLSHWPDGQNSEFVPRNTKKMDSGGIVLIEVRGKRSDEGEIRAGCGRAVG